MQFLKQSTAVDIRIGPAVDATDGVTPETTLTIASADQAEILKHNGEATVAMAGTLAAVTGCDGWYDYTCSTGDVDTLGQLSMVIQDASLMLPIFKDFMVVPANTYDSLIAAVADTYLKADIQSIGADVDAGTNFKNSTSAMASGQAATGTLTATIFTTNISGTYATANALNGRVILFLGDVSSALKGQAGIISDYDPTGGKITIASPLTVAPGNTDGFIIV